MNPHAGSTVRLAILPLTGRRALLFRLREVVLHQVQLTELLARAAVPGIERQRLFVVLQRDAEVAGIALGVAQ